MDKLNQDLPVTEEENKPSEVDMKKEISPLLLKVRQNYGIFGTISLIFGGAFTLFFYQAGIGLNTLVFTIVMIILLSAVSNKLGMLMKKETIVYYLGATLLGLSSMLTSNSNLHFLNVIGIMLLLDLSLLSQYQKKKDWDFVKHLSRMFALPFQSLASIGMPFSDGNSYIKKTKLLKNDKTRNILIGVIISIPLILIIGGLLSSADLIFNNLTNKIYKFLFSGNIYQIILMVILGFLFCYTVICGAVGQTDEKTMERKKADPQIAFTVTTLLSVVYAVFCGIQIAYLFTEGIFVLPEGFTYAEYARRGFFELLAVTCFNMLLILVCTILFRESKLLKANLAFITLFTYIMIASSAYRMLLYIGTYHLTFLRLFVLLFLIIDAIILGGTIVYVYHKRFPLFGFSVAVVSICYLLFAFAKPDYFIASYQVKYDKELNAEDIAFFTNELSKDAAPVLIPILQEIYNEIPEYTVQGKENEYYFEAIMFSKYDIENYYNKIEWENENRDIRDFNLSYYIARKYTDKYPIKREQ